MPASQPSYNDILKLFEENSRLLKEVALAQRETDKKFQDTAKQFQETDKKFQETDLKIMRVNESIGRLGNRLGDFVEEMVKPAAVRLFQAQGLDVHEVHRGVEAHRDGDDIEIDLLVVNTTDVIAIECKSQLSIDDVNQHIHHLQKLKKLLPTYTDKKVMGAVAAMVLPDNVARYAYKQGLYVIAQSGDHLLIRNDAKFIPRSW